MPTTSTWEDGREIAALVRQEGVHSILLITDWYHSRRALCVVRRQLAPDSITLYYEPPPTVAYNPDNWWHSEDGLVSVVNELVKFGFYWWHYGVAPWQC